MHLSALEIRVELSVTFFFKFQGSVHAGIPVVIFGAFSTSAGLLALMLPETLNRKLPESVAEVERSGRRKVADDTELQPKPVEAE